VFVVAWLGAAAAWAQTSQPSGPAKTAEPSPPQPPPPSTDPATLPAPTLGLRFTNPHIAEAARLVEQHEFSAAAAILQNLLKDPNLTGDSKDQVRVGQALILIRCGQLVKANDMLMALVSLGVPDSGIRDNESAVRQAQVLEMIHHTCKPTKADPAPLADADAWSKAIKRTGMTLMDNLRKARSQSHRHADSHDWKDVEIDIDASRRHLECLDTIRDSLDPSVWKEATKLHAEAIQEAIAGLNARAPELYAEMDYHANKMFLMTINASEGNRWVPMQEVTKYNEARNELVRAYEVAIDLQAHYERAAAKWHAQGIFDNPLVVEIHREEIPEARLGSLVDPRDPRKKIR
jgi:hypothetical protein